MARRKPKRSSRPARPAASVARDASELCLQCGLCCDGTLFGDIRLQPDEREHVESLGLQVHAKPDGGLQAPQPCPAFVDGCCALYTVGRPATCSNYRCGVLVRYVAGDVGLDDALASLRLVRSFAREIEVEMGLPFGVYDRARFSEYLLEHEPWKDPERYARLLVAFYRLTTLGAKYFGYDAKPMEVQAAAAGEEVAMEAARS